MEMEYIHSVIRWVVANKDLVIVVSSVAGVLVSAVSFVCTFALAVFAFTTWRENRKSVNFEMIQKLEETYGEKVSSAFGSYFRERKDFQVVGASFYPDEAGKDIGEMLRWYSSLGMMLPLKIVDKVMIERYKYRFRIVAKDAVIRGYFRELATIQDDSKLAEYRGFFRLVEFFGDKDLKNAYKSKVLKGTNV